MRPRENQRNWFKRYDAAHAFGENLPEHGRTAQARRDRLHHFTTIHRTDPNPSVRDRRRIGFRVKSRRAKALSQRNVSA
jgi:hypothetical protein